MASTDHTVRVFISSTFRDMHAERDHLVTVVFPELRERVEQLGLEFFDVDLRWGVPAKDANGETANSWEYCRQWIDRVEPFFVCILGQRYGWEPEPEQLKDSDDRQRQQAQKRSITDMEVRHAVLDTRLSRRSFFYLREDGAPASASEFVDPPLLLDKLKEFKDEISSCGRPVRPYPCRWTGEGFAEMERFGRLVLDDLWSGVLRDRRYVSKEVWRQALGADPDTDPLYTGESQPVPRELWEKIVELAKPEPKEPLDAEREQMDAFAATRLRWFQGRTRELEQLTSFLNEPSADAPRLAVVAAVPGQGKSALLAKLHEQLKPSPHFVITHFVGATERSASAYSLVERLLGELDRSGIAWPAEQQEGQELKRDFNRLCLRLAQRLGDYAGERRIVVLLDALNQLSDGHDLQWLPTRLGPSVRAIVSCIDDTSAKADSHEQRVLQALASRRSDPLRVKLGALTPEDVRTIVVAYLDEYCKVLDTEQVTAIRSLPQARNPLYLLVMLGELRTLGGNDMNRIVGELIASMPLDHPDTVSLFRWVLQRLEVFGRDAVQWWCLYLAHGRVGMSSHELADLLARKLGADAAVTALRIERGLRRYLQRRGPQLDFFHGQLRQAVFEQYGPQVEATTVHSDIANYFREVAIERDEEFPKWSWDQKRSLSELPHHQLNAGMWDVLEKTLTDIAFVEVKSRTGMVYDLIRDYAAAERAWPGQEEERRREEERQQRIQDYVDALIAYSRAHTAQREGRDVEIPPLPVPPPSVARTSEPEVADARREWTPLERVQVWKHFVSNHTVALSSEQETAFQVALNSADSGPVADALEHRLRLGNGPSAPWLRLTNRPLFSLHPTCLRTLEGHTGEVTAVAVTSDGRRTVSGSVDKTLRIWDLETGYTSVLEGHTGAVRAVAVTPDGRRAVSGGDDWTFRIWDLETGHSRVLQGHRGLVYAVAVTPDGRRAVSGSHSINTPMGPSGSDLCVWDLETGHPRVLEGHTGGVNAIAVMPDGRCAVSIGCYPDNTLRVWDLETGHFRVLQEPSSDVNAVAVTPDSRLAVSGSSDRTLRIWNLETGHSRVLARDAGVFDAVAVTPDGRYAVSEDAVDNLRIWNLETGHSRVLEGHTGGVTAIAVTPDGRRAVSGSHDNTLRVWDLETGYSPVLEGHTGVTAIAVTPDGRRAISGGWGKTLHVWDLKSGHSHVLEGYCGFISALALYTYHRIQGDKDNPSVSPVAVTPDGRRAISGGERGTPRVWDLEKGHSRVLARDAGVVNAVAVTPDGRAAVSGSREVWLGGDKYVGRGKTLRVWDLETGHFRVLQGHSSDVNAVAVTPDGRCVVSGSNESYEKTLRVWDLETGHSRVLQGHTSIVGAVAVTPDGRHAVSAGVWNLNFSECRRDPPRVWDLKTGHSRVLQIHTAEEGGLAWGAIGLAVTPDGRRAVSGGEDKTLRVWDLETGENISIYTSVAGRINSMAQRFPMVVVGRDTGRVEFLLLIGARHASPLPLLGPRITTAARLWLFRRRESGLPRLWDRLRLCGGHWDDAVTVLCDACGQRFQVPATILDTIAAITRTARIGLDDSPCLSLPAEAWDEPRLVGECPLCHEPLKFNPFVLDNRDRYPAP